MASSYSSLLRLEKMANGELDDLWGTQLNNVLEMIEDSVSGRASVTHDDTANYTLTTANGTVDEARNMIVNVGGTLTAARNVVCPTSAKLYVVKNATTGGFAFTFKTTAGTGISVANGKILILMCDGTNVVNAIDDPLIARLDTEDQTLTGGVIVTSKSLGTISSGTVTPDPGDRPLQHYTNGGAHTIAPSVNGGSILVDITNNASAGAITTSGFTKVAGDSFTTTNAHKFRCQISIGNGGSLLSVQALQ